MSKILVVANPSHALDHKGRPACAVPTEGALTWICATLDAEASTKEGAAVFVFSDVPVEVDATPYYLRQIEEGALLLATGPSVARAIPRISDTPPKS